MNGNANWLILIPTESEKSRLEFGSLNANVAICGFGPVVSAARTAALISDLRPKKILLLGIAGTYSNLLKTGAAYQFRHTRCHGVGIGNGKKHMTAAEAGWKQFDSEPEITDVLDLSFDSGIPDAIASGVLQTVCSASGEPADANEISSKYPDAVAEDMEGFAVAAAAALFSIPVYVVRGISNQAGDRQQQNWQIDDALSAANELATQIIRNDS